MVKESGDDSAQFKRILSNPKYHELVRKRRRFAWTLSIIMLVIYYAFIVVIAFKPAILATQITSDSIITIGIPIGVGIILSAFILTWIFVMRANGAYDRLTSEIKELSK
ncbi:MAG: DUF485 domain-containing protein [Magnetococcus sp. DMHC-1]|nr:DUF485 domain-containing protein [Magnetococcales bacterium]